MAKRMLQVSLSAIIAANLVSVATAQGSGATATHAAGSAGESVSEDQGLTEIVVTAQRREERLQSVPVSVSVVTSGALAAQGITTLSVSDLSRAVPALSGQSITGKSLYFLRGVGSSSSSLVNEPSVAFYMDGVYLGYAQSNATDFNNIERIEVLKGPQGTLFGRNASGGVVQIITKDPSLTKSSVSADIGYANYQTVRASVYASTPITDSVAVNLAGTYRDQGDGWGRNKNLNKDVYKGWSYGVRGKVL